MKVYNENGDYKIIPKEFLEHLDISLADMSTKRLTPQERRRLEQCVRYGANYYQLSSPTINVNINGTPVPPLDYELKTFYRNA